LPAVGVVHQVNAMVEPDYWSQASKCDPNTAGAMATATHCSTPHGDTTKGGASAAPNQKILQSLRHSGEASLGGTTSQTNSPPAQL